MKPKSLIIYCLYLWLFIFSLIPFLWLLSASFLSHGTDKLIRLPITLANYTTLWNFTFIKIVLRSLILASLVTFVCLLLAYPFSYFLIKAKRQSLLLLLIVIPFWTSSLIRTYALLILLKHKGLINTWLTLFHLPTVELLYSSLAVVIGLVYNLFPFMVLPLFINMERFDFSLIEAAQDLGASKWTIFLKIFLPNTVSGIVAGGLLVFLPAITLFYIPNILGGARSMLLGNLIQDEFLILANWPKGAATSVFITGFLMLIFIVYQRFHRNN